MFKDITLTLNISQETAIEKLRQNNQSYKTEEKEKNLDKVPVINN